MPKVSVIISTFNCERYVEEAIRSVTRQTERDLEIIVVDDGSTDSTLLLAGQLAVEDQRIAVHTMPHTGYPGASRNCGLALARGEYVVFLDGDDLYHSEKIRRGLAALEAVPEASVLFHDFGMFQDALDEGTGFLKKRAFVCSAAKHLTEVGPDTYSCDRDLYSFMSVRFIPFRMCSAMVRRQALDSQGLLFREDLWEGEDGDFWLRLSVNCRAVFLDCVLSYYRQRPGSLSSDRIKYLLGAIQIHTENLERGKRLLGDKDKRLYRSKIAALLFDLGNVRFRSGDRKEARIAYRRSMRVEFNVRALVAHLKTFAPDQVVRMRRRWEDDSSRDRRVRSRENASV